ncbi:MAG TPA: ankyrin repeat domain-containing protein [Bryobacteraceae bacterium]|nr:ankyrin repeat domain-containing protein [Bryobacteraceae bacterium]
MKWLFFCIAAAGFAAPPAPLVDAVRSGNRAAMESLLARKADPNAAQPDGTTPLHWAAREDNVEAARLLLKAGAQVKAVNQFGVTPLSLACENGSGPMAELLLKAGADANGTLPGGETMLMTAARTGRVEAVRALITAGANVNAREGRGAQTALMWAAAEGNGEVVGELLHAKADRDARVDSGFTAFLFAVREGQLGVVRTLVKAGVDVNETVQPGLLTGKKFGQVRAGPRSGTGALTIAVTNAHYELAAFLLDAGADPNAALPGFTALHVLPTVRKPGVGDNDPAPDGSGSMTAIAFVRKMAAKGANLNARMTKRVGFGLTSINTVGATPFFMAARTADAELMRVLAELGADPKINNTDNSTPLMAAAGLGTRSPGEDSGTEPEVLEAMQVALDLGNDINAVDNNGETAMHSAAYKNYPKAVEFLAAHGARREVWDKKNKQGWTPLRIAEGYRFGNFKPSPVTVEALHRVMGIQ